MYAQTDNTFFWKGKKNKTKWLICTSYLAVKNHLVVKYECNRRKATTDRCTHMFYDGVCLRNFIL